jgi:hypothetical protein
MTNKWAGYVASIHEMGNIVSWKEHVSRTRSSWEDEIEIKAKPR